MIIPSKILQLVAFSAMIAIPATVPAAIYKWTDENGQTIYSELPPPRGVKTERIQSAPRPSVDPEAAMEDLRKRSEAFNKRRDENMQSTDEAAQTAEQEKVRQERCNKLRANLELLSSGKRLNETQEDGSIVTIDEEQRQAKIKATQERIDKNCQN